MTPISTTMYSPKADVFKNENKLVAGLLDQRWLYLDVFPDGKALVGTGHNPSEGAILQFSHMAVFANCTPTFMPEVGTIAFTGYINDGAHAINDSNANYRLEGYTDLDLDVHDLDDDTGGNLSVYAARIRCRIHKAKAIYTVARLDTYLLSNIVRQQLADHDFTRTESIWTKAA